MSIKIPYMRKDKSTLLAFSAIALLMLASPLLLSNFLLQQAQAQTSMTFRTTQPAITTDPNTGLKFTLTFAAQGTMSSSNPQSGSITEGTFQISSEQDGKIATSGHISQGQFSNSSSGASISMVSTVVKGPDTYHYTIITDCSKSNDNEIIVEIEGGPRPEYSGPVECSSSSQGGGNTASSMTGTTTAQDGDGDGIPDSSDRCAHNSNTKCFKEGDASATTTSTQQQQ
ncbi:MAG: hypothetical protein ACJ703_04900 [Nitrososphaera sp.]